MARIFDLRTLSMQDVLKIACMRQGASGTVVDRCRGMVGVPFRPAAFRSIPHHAAPPRTSHRPAVTRSLCNKWKSIDSARLAFKG